MNLLRRHLLISSAAATLVPVALAHAQVVDMNDAINKAGRQRIVASENILQVMEHVTALFARSSA